MNKLRIGISCCLLGRLVRYDGQHQKNSTIIDFFDQCSTDVEWVAICPEVECGMSIPRDSMQLTGEINSPRLVVAKTKCDMTQQLQNWTPQGLKKIKAAKLSGFIFKSKSPSCGLEKVKLYNKKKVEKVARGLFADAVVKAFPNLPVAEAESLQTDTELEDFLSKILMAQNIK
jgi:uncharacterized protein YbbK (DUF523 family)